MLLAHSTRWKLIPLSTVVPSLILLLSISWTRVFVFTAFLLLWSRRAILRWLILFLFAIRLLFILTAKRLIQYSTYLTVAHHATLFLIRISASSTATFVHTSRVKLSLRISLSWLSGTSFTWVLQVARSLSDTSRPWMRRFCSCYISLTLLLRLVSILYVSWDCITLCTCCFTSLLWLLTIAIIICISLIRVILRIM